MLSVFSQSSGDECKSIDCLDRQQRVGGATHTGSHHGTFGFEGMAHCEERGRYGIEQDIYTRVVVGANVKPAVFGICAGKAGVGRGFRRVLRRQGVSG